MRLGCGRNVVGEMAGLRELLRCLVLVGNKPLVEMELCGLRE